MYEFMREDIGGEGRMVPYVFVYPDYTIGEKIRMILWRENKEISHV